MSTSDIRPKWWQLYLAFPLIVALFLLDERLRISIRAHQVVQIGIILIVYALMHMWVNANAAILLRMDRNRYCGAIRVIRFSAPANKETDSLLELSDPEIMGVLRYTFE